MHDRDRAENAANRESATEQFDQATQAVNESADAFTEALSDLSEAAQSFDIQGVVESTGDSLTALGNLLETGAQTPEQAAEGIGDLIEADMGNSGDGMELAGAVIGEGLEGTVEMFSEVGEAAGEIVAEPMQDIGEGISTAGEAIQSAQDAVEHLAQGDFEQAREDAGEAVDSGRDAVSSIRDVGFDVNANLAEGAVEIAHEALESTAEVSSEWAEGVLDLAENSADPATADAMAEARLEAESTIGEGLDAADEWVEDSSDELADSLGLDDAIGGDESGESENADSSVDTSRSETGGGEGGNF